MDLYLESVLRSIFGVSESTMRVLRAEALAGMDKNVCEQVVIQGRTHVAYPMEVVEKILGLIAAKKNTPGVESVLSDVLGPEDLSDALVRGVPAEMRGVSDDGKKVRADLVTLTVKRITKNRLAMEAEDPEGAEVILRVGDTRRFIEGMEVPGCRIDVTGVYVFEGRLPRSRGRW